MPRRPDDEYDDFDDRRDDDRAARPRRRRDDGGPAPTSGGGAGRLLLILLLVGGGLVVLCCGGCGSLMYFAVRSQVTILEATRAPSAQGGTQSVTVNVKIGGDSPGGFVRGDYVFNFKAGGKTVAKEVGLIGRAGGEYRSTFPTPELATESGPVEFWVERGERGSTTRVSAVRTIP